MKPSSLNMKFVAEYFVGISGILHVTVLAVVAVTSQSSSQIVIFALVGFYNVEPNPGAEVISKLHPPAKEHDF